MATNKDMKTEDMLYDAIRKRVSESKGKPVSKTEPLSNSEAMEEAYNAMKHFFANNAEKIDGQGLEYQKNVLVKCAHVAMAILDELKITYTQDDIQLLIDRLAKELDDAK